MTVLDLLTHLRALDVNLRVDGEQLHFDAPPGALTPELRETLRSRKRELVDYLCDLRGRQATVGPIGRATRSGPPRVSFAQRRMWFLQQLTPESLLYNLPGALRLTGPLDAHALRQSLVEIQERHEVLRTTFALQDDEPVQQISDHVDLVLPITDLRGLPDEEAQARLRALTTAWSRQPFDLSAGPLFRAHLAQLSEREHVLLLAFHHIVCDGWSIGVFVRELTTLYGAFVQGRPSPLPALPLQYADFAEWQRDWLQGPVLESQLAYWRRQLALPLAVLELPTDRPRPALQTFNGALHWFTVPAKTVAGLEALGRERGATLFMALLAAFKVLLFRYSGQTDVIVGSPIANRSRPELESLLGFFVNSIALRTKLAHDQSFLQVLDQVREVCLGAFEHQDVPLETLVEEIRPDRDTRRSPLYQVMFALQTAPGAPLELPELTVASIELEAVTAKFDLTLSLKQAGDSLTGVFEYNTDLFDRSTIESMTSAFCALLTQVVGAPGGRVGAVELLGAGERAAVVAGGTGAAGAYPREATLGALVGAQVAARPDAVAVEDGATRWTYGEVGRRAAQLAGVLRAAGVGPNVAVGVWLERGAPLVTTLVGIAVAGGAYVPLEVTQPAGRAAELWAAAGTAVVVTTAAGAATVPAGPWRVVTLEAVAGAPAAAVAPQGTATDLAYVLYTSGSTGTPKGVAVPQRAVVRLVCGTDYVRLGPETVVGQAATAAFDAATFEIWGALLHGGRVVVVPTAVAVAPGALGAYLQRTGVTTLFLTTALVHQIGREAPGALAGLDTVLFGGEAVEPRWVAAIQAAGGPRRLVHVYGPTETTTFATWYAVGAVEGDAGTIPIGGPIAQTQVYVLDGGGGVVPVGVPGELYIGGDGLAQGYVGAARQTAARFVPDGVSGAAGARLYRTGDVGRWTAPGVLTFLGRRDGQVKLRGYRIELGEVEAALTGLPAVGAAAVVVQGAGDARRLVGYVVAAAGATLEAGALRTALKTQLPGYMVPATLVVVPGLPLNANGKVDRGALPAVAAGAAAAGEGGGGAPRSTVEAQIAAVWAQALGVATVGVGDNFFDVGGHSLLLVRVQAGLEAALGRRVPLVTLFQYPTVEGLAAHLTGAAAAAPPAGRAAGAAGPAGIAVIGVAGRFPGAPDVATFWGNLRAGVESIRQFSAAELAAAGVPAALAGDPRYVPARGVLAEVAGFDAGLFGYTPREAALLDPQQRLLLECAWTALEQAGYAAGTRQAVRIGVFAGTSANTYLSAAGRGALTGVSPLQVLLASDKDFLATRVSYKLRLTGPSVTVQTACSTSLVAVHLACQALAAGECEIALAGGVSVTVPEGGYLYHPDGIASPDGHCRAFDAGAAGTVAGNGVGMVVLKPLGAALAAGDTIQAVIRGTAINNDGADKVGFTAPSVSGQAAVVAAAQAAAGVGAASIGYIEAHGTGTALGDPIEVAALREVFGAGAGPGTCGLGSVKTNVGHLDAAAGVTGLIKTVLALQQGEIPPSLHFAQANPQLDLGPFYVPTTVTPWRAAAGTPRRAGVSAFGMGGTNAHVIVEEAPARAAAPGDAAAGDGVPGDAATAGPAAGRAWQVVPVSGQSAAAVAAAAEQLATYLETHPAAALADVAYTQQVGRTALGQRRVAVGPDAATVAAQLRTGGTETAGAAGRPVVWMFPGQGTQTVGMGRALYAQAPGFRAELEACAAVVAAVLGGDLIGVLYPAPGGEAAAAARLAEPAWTQVGLVAVELALAAQWRAWGVTPQAVIGHSVGELAAACVAGVLTREAALRLAATRGTLMGAAPAGGLLAVGAGAEAVTPHLGADLWLAAVNSPTQCVVAGTGAALRTGAARLAAAGYATQPLAAAGAFHSGLLAGVVAPLTAAAAALPLAPPHLPWISTVTGTALTAAEATDPAYWGRQVTAPVQWAAAVTTARATLGAAPLWLEVGPGPTLTRLTRAGAAPEERALASLTGPDAAQSVATALAQLWTAGVPLDWAATHAGAPRRRLPLPTYPFQHRRYWLDPAPQRAPLDVFSATAKKPDVGSWFHRALWKQAAALSTRPPESKQPRRWLMFADDATLVDQLTARLSGGDQTIVVEAGDEFSARDGQRYTIRPDVPGDYDTLIQSIDATGGLPTDIVHLWGVTLESERDSTEVAIDDRCFYSLLYLAQALSHESMAAPVRLTVVTNHVHAVTGQEDLCPAKAVVMGPCRTIPAEFRHVSCSQVDIVWPDGGQRVHSAIDRLTAELLADNRPAVVAHRGAHRWVPAFEPVATPSSTTGAARLRLRGTYLVTGGLGGVGLALAETLAELAQARLVLVGRTALPRREEWSSYVRDHRDDRVSERIERLLALESMGADVLVISADVASAAQMDAALRQAHARFGQIHGVIHAAGVGGDGLIALKSREDATGVLTPKVAGTHALERLLDSEPLDFLVLCSSLTAFLGGLGQVDYCAANAFLDAYAQARWCQGDERVVSINWDTWGDVGMAVDTPVPSQLARRKEQVLESGMTASEGKDVFLRALALRAPQVTVCTKELGALIDMMAAATLPRPELADEDASPRPRHPRPALTTAHVAPSRELERVVCAAFERALGLEGIGIHDNFFELGGHSVLAVDMMSDLNSRLHASVPVAALYEGLTPGSLASLFEDDREGRSDARETVGAGRRRDKSRRPTGATRRRDSRIERRQRP